MEISPIAVNNIVRAMFHQEEAWNKVSHFVEDPTSGEGEHVLSAMKLNPHILHWGVTDSLI